MRSVTNMRSNKPLPSHDGLRGRRLLGLAGFVALIVVGVLLVPSLLPPAPASQSGLAPSASIPPWNTWTCNPNNPSPAALDIPVANPTQSEPLGENLTVTFEFEVEEYVATDFGITINLPTTSAVLPTTPSGSLSLTFPPRNVSIAGAGWSSSLLLNRTVTLTSSETFSGDSAYLSTSKYAVMADAVSGSLTLEFRWRWSFATVGGGSPTNGPWTVPSVNATSPYLPSIFYPAPYLGVVHSTPSPAAASSSFRLELNGTVANTSFRVVLEYPNNGTEIQSIWENTSVKATIFNASVPTAFRGGSPLPAGTYIIHIHDICEAIVHILSVVVIEFSPPPALGLLGRLVLGT